MATTSDCKRFLVPVLLAAALAQGCRTTAAKQPAERAEAAVEAFLDAWTRGDSPEKFADPGQPIQASDPDWKAGYRLLSFLSIDARPSAEAPQRFRCRVALSLQDRRGAKTDKEVVYDVQLGERTVISRAAR
jgi:hypothetical protein